MDEYKDIRPYLDHEIRPVLDSLLRNPQFIRSVSRFYYPRLSSLAGPLIDLLARRRLDSQLTNVNSVATMQDVVAKYMEKMIADTTTGLSSSGLDQLDHERTYLFMSNHRDIAMDPALVNYLLYHGGLDTLQIAIGDNLLKKPFVTDLMRLNKSFIVRRSLKGRELLKSLDLMSRYIHHCVGHGHNVWIAQREGRAKDGVDKTDPALIKMLARGRKDLTLRESLSNLHIVPVALSYEYDACDLLKAVELHQVETTGKFEKTDESDIQSIVTGIIGFKGHVHIGFGEELRIESDDPDEVAAQIDRQILLNYRLQDSNYLALELLRERGLADLPPLSAALGEHKVDAASREKFQNRLAAVDPALHRHYLNMYANPAIRRYTSTGAA